MTFLLLSLAALLVGPLLFAFARARRGLPPLLDWAVVVSITGLVLLESYDEVRDGPTMLLLAVGLAGLFGPTVIEWVLHHIEYHRIEAQAHLLTLLLGIAGVGVHALLDGGALASAPAGINNLLPAAVALHRIPVGLTIWWLLRPVFGTRGGWAGLVFVSAATVVGFALGPRLLSGFSSGAIVGFRTFVSGTLLHVVFFRAHTDRHGHEH